MAELEYAQENATEALTVVEPAELAIPDASEFHGYVGASLLKLTDAEASSLAAILPDDDHDILPTGEVYVTQVRYRRLLNATLGPGQWALVPRGNWTKHGNTLCREYALVVRGSFVAEAVGEAEYQPDNDRMSWATAAESAKSNALTRCCKDLGIASECWDRRWTAAWIKQYAVKVWCEPKSKRDPKGHYQWRRRDSAPFWNEKGGRSEERDEEPAARAEPKPAAPAPPPPTAEAELASEAMAEELAGAYAETKSPEQWAELTERATKSMELLLPAHRDRVRSAARFAKKDIARLAAEAAA